jgi:hypothetical protein
LNAFAWLSDNSSKDVFDGMTGRGGEGFGIRLNPDPTTHRKSAKYPFIELKSIMPGRGYAPILR